MFFFIFVFPVNMKAIPSDMNGGDARLATAIRIKGYTWQGLGGGGGSFFFLVHRVPFQLERS